MALTKSQLIDAIAQRASVEKKTAETMLDCLAQLAYENAKDEFTFPGIGKLVVVDRKARTARNPQTGAAIEIPAKKGAQVPHSQGGEGRNPWGGGTPDQQPNGDPASDSLNGDVALTHCRWDKHLKSQTMNVGKPQRCAPHLFVTALMLLARITSAADRPATSPSPPITTVAQDWGNPNGMDRQSVIEHTMRPYKERAILVWILTLWPGR